MLNLLISFLITLTLHEYLHYLFAKKFNRKPVLKFDKLVFPCIEYNNSNKYLENCIISMSPLVLHLILALVSVGFLRLINLCFLIMILPITSDGMIFWINMIKYISKLILDLKEQN